MSLQKIAKAMGHASTRTTERYAKVSEESLREIALALDSVISDSFSDSSGVANGGEAPQVLSSDGAGNRVRTGDIQLGKLTLYQLSYARAKAENIANPAGERNPPRWPQSEAAVALRSRTREVNRGSRIFAKSLPFTKRTGMESP